MNVFNVDDITFSPTASLSEGLPRSSPSKVMGDGRRAMTSST